MITEGIGRAGADRPTSDLIAASVGGRCANCQAPMASDQRYCLNCGQRRGRPRFPIGSTAPSTETVAVRSEAPPPYRPRVSPAATLIAGVATLLIALGVGVLIGQETNKSTTRASAPVQLLNVGGGGSSAASSTTPAQAAQSSTATKAATAKHPKVVVVHLTPKLQQKAAQAASKVFGQSGNLSKNVTQQVGQACSGGAGCQNGKFTGNFFSGG